MPDGELFLLLVMVSGGGLGPVRDAVRDVRRGVWIEGGWLVVVAYLEWDARRPRRGSACSCLVATT